MMWNSSRAIVCGIFVRVTARIHGLKAVVFACSAYKTADYTLCTKQIREARYGTRTVYHPLFL